MMKNFAYVKAKSLADATKALATRNAKVIAGGTDLLGCMRDEIFPVDKVVSIGGLAELKGISALPDGGMRIGARTAIADIAANAALAQKYPVLAQAAAQVASPQLRNQGTLGGNLCQRPRCWYYRGDFRCARKGGELCYAMDGENQYHAVFGGGPCFYVHPSDTAVALVALEAQVVIAGSAGKKAVKMDKFFIDPGVSLERENILTPQEIITEIRLPAPGGKVLSSYHKIKARQAWDFAIVSVGLVLNVQNDAVSKAGILLGGVGPYPWRAAESEKLLIGKRIDGASAAAAGQAATAGATALGENAYKIRMIQGAVEESISAFIQ
jgi:xanthine dehydrogenase YagS FAD-binding subunit